MVSARANQPHRIRDKALRGIALVVILVLYATYAYIGDPAHGGGHGSVGPAVTLSPAASARADQQLKDLERSNKVVPKDR